MELIHQISNSEDPIPVIKQFSSTVAEHPDRIEAVFTRLFQAMRSKTPRNRANIALAISHLMMTVGVQAKKGNRVDLSFVYNLSKEVLNQGSSSIVNRRSTVALFIAWPAMVKSGYYAANQETVQMMVRHLHGLANSRTFYRAIGYASIFSIMDLYCKDTEAFKQFMFKELFGEMGPLEVPPHADSFNFWLRISQRYPDLHLGKWADSPTASVTLRSLSSVCENTMSILPSIHQLWFTLAKHDAAQLVNNAMELWSNAKDQTFYIPAVATAAAFQVIDVAGFLGILQHNADYFTKVSRMKHGSIVIDAAIEAGRKFSAQHTHRVVSIASAMIRAFPSKSISAFASHLEDPETKELIASATDFPFVSALELAYSLSKKANLHDASLVQSCFDLLVTKAQSDEEKAQILTFLSHVVDTATEEGALWFSILTSGKVEPPMIISSEQSAVQKANHLLKALKFFYQKVGKDCEESEMENLSDAIDKAAELISAKCELSNAIGRSIIGCSLPYLSKELFDKVKDDPFVLIQALNTPEHSITALNLLLSNPQIIPRAIITHADELKINSSEENSMKMIETIMSSSKGTVLKAFNQSVYSELVSHLSEEKLNALCEKVVSDSLANIGKDTVDFIPIVAKIGEKAAHKVFTSIVLKISPELPAVALKRCRSWIDDICSRYQFGAAEVGDAVVKVTLVPCGDKVSDRKKAEDALGWAAAFVQSQKEKLPLSGLKPTLEKLENSQSKTVKTFVKQLLETIAQ